jgi:glutathione synthase/RimK-type ligase-like ATP-grasp enzyme
MMAFPFTIQIEDNKLFPEGIEILLNRDALYQLGVPAATRIQVTFGVRVVPVAVGISSASKSIMLISRSLAERLLIPFNTTVFVWYSKKRGRLNLGPVLGILLTKANPGKPDPFGSYTSFCEEACEAANLNHSLCYIVTLDNIDPEKGAAKGWILRNRRWEEHRFPLPHALYNRLTNRIKERTDQIQKQLQHLKEHDVSIFNEKFLNKWEVYQILSTTAASSYLPATNLCKGNKPLLQMLSQYSTLFLKPIHGSEGKGIIRIRKSGQGFIVDQILVNGIHTKYYSTIAELIKTLNNIIRRRVYIIQEGIPFIHANGSAIDFRVLLQKNRNGVWKVVSMVARKGNVQSFVSNLAQGGKIERPSSVLNQFRASNPLMPTNKKLGRTAKEIATCLDQHLDGNYGEFGIDLGVDHMGRIWLIEINSKPSKKDEALLADVKKPRPSVVHLFEYLFFLANVPNSNNTDQGKRTSNVPLRQNLNRR